MTCTECKDTGIYTGLDSIEPRRACETGKERKKDGDNRFRVQAFTIGEDDILAVLRGTIVIEGIPEGAEFVHADRNMMRLGFQVVVRHWSYEPLEESKEIPSFTPTVRYVTP